MPHRFKKGVEHHNARLDPEKVRLIRQLRENGVTTRELGREFGVSATTIDRVCQRKIWREVD